MAIILGAFSTSAVINALPSCVDGRSREGPALNHDDLGFHQCN